MKTQYVKSVVWRLQMAFVLMQYALVKYLCSLQRAWHFFWCQCQLKLLQLPAHVLPPSVEVVLLSVWWCSGSDFSIDPGWNDILFLDILTVSNSNYFPRQSSGLPEQWYQCNWGSGNEMPEATGGCLNWHCSFSYTFIFSLQNFWLCLPKPKNNEKVTATESLILPWICRT